MKYELKLTDLKYKKDLWSDKTVEKLEKQLKEAGRNTPDNKRYKVNCTINEGNKSRVKDVDNYSKPILDAITYTKVLWIDDEQVDEILVKRIRDSKEEKTSVQILIEKILS